MENAGASVFADDFLRNPPTSGDELMRMDFLPNKDSMVLVKKAAVLLDTIGRHEIVVRRTGETQARRVPSEPGDAVFRAAAI